MMGKLLEFFDFKHLGCHIRPDLRPLAHQIAFADSQVASATEGH
jgi:hypothetical protein